MISVQQFSKSCGCRSAGECSCNVTAEFEALDALVDAFASEMKKKLRTKAIRDGFLGWDDPENATGIAQAMRTHCARGIGQEIDVANLAAMLWNFQQP